MQKILIEKATNVVDDIEQALNKRIAELGIGWRIVSASTAIETCSVRQEGFGSAVEDIRFSDGYPRHVIYVTTVVVEKVE